MSNGSSRPTVVSGAQPSDARTAPDTTIRATIRRPAARALFELGVSVPPESEALRLPPISVDFREAPATPDRKGAGRTGADLKIIGLLGQGGMGTVYLARQIALDREVAVKLPTSATLSNASLLAEARLAGSLEHPNVVPVHALGCDDEGEPVLVMKRIEGYPWSELLHDDQHPAWSREDLASEDRLTTHLEILMQVANATHFAHTRGIIHRDIKPENVMLGNFGEVYVVDWGIACHRGVREPRHVVGTPAYMAPEMLEGDTRSVDPRTDVYLLGSTLHEVLTGRIRHEGSSLCGVFDACGRSEAFPYGPEVPVELAALCNAATDPDRSKRPQSAAAFRQAIASYLRHRTSIGIAASAQQTLDGIFGLMASGLPVSDGEIAQHLAECRFGFLEALRSWPANEPAQRGLDATLTVMVERHIVHRNVDAARAVIAEMRGPALPLIERVEALAADVRASQEERAREARDRDPSLSAGTRIVVMSIVVAVFVVSFLAATWNEVRSGVQTTMWEVLMTDLLVLGVAVLAGTFATKSLLINRYNRRFFGAFAIIILATTLCDFIGWWKGMDSRVMNMLDLVTVLSTLSVLALTQGRLWWWANAPLAIGLVVAAIWPATANGATGTAMIISLYLVLLFSWREAAAKTLQTEQRWPTTP